MYVYVHIIMIIVYQQLSLIKCFKIWDSCLDHFLGKCKYLIIEQSKNLTESICLNTTYFQYCLLLYIIIKI